MFISTYHFLASQSGDQYVYIFRQACFVIDYCKYFGFFSGLMTELSRWMLFKDYYNASKTQTRIVTGNIEVIKSNFSLKIGTPLLSICQMNAFKVSVNEISQYE